MNVRALIRGYIARVVRWGKISVSPASGYVQMEGRDADPDEPESQQKMRWLQTYGIASKPRAGSEVVAVSLGGAASNRVAIASATPGAGPQTQEDGEVELYSEHGQRVVLDKDGRLTVSASGSTIVLKPDGTLAIDAKAGSDVVVNGGTAKVAVEGTDVDCGALSVVVSMTGIAQVYWWAPGTLTFSPVPNYPAKLPITGKIGPGSARFKA